MAAGGGLSTSFVLPYHGQQLRVLYTTVAKVVDSWVDTHFPDVVARDGGCSNAAATPGAAASGWPVVAAGTGNAPTVVGLDVEWRPQFRKGAPPSPVALIQLGTTSNHVLLFHVHHAAQWRLPAGLAAVLRSPTVVKAGVGVVDDARKLHEQYGVHCHALLELQVLVDWKGDVAMKGRGLETLAAHYASAPAWKSKSVTVRRRPTALLFTVLGHAAPRRALVL
jgi:hypothetical protein